MTARKKTQPRSPSARITETWHRRPWLTLTTIGTAVAILSAVGPVVVATLHYFTTHAEFVAHQQHDEAKDAWSAVRQAESDAINRRNRVNDCNVLREKKGALSPLERAVCLQYDDDLRDAQAALVKLKAEALLTTKEKQP